VSNRRCTVSSLLSVLCIGGGGERDDVAGGNDEEYAVVVTPCERRTAKDVQTSEEVHAHGRPTHVLLVSPEPVLMRVSSILKQNQQRNVHEDLRTT